MNKTFTASNGIKVFPDVLGEIQTYGPHPIVVKPRMRTVALREFFLHERDQKLGRWRWPENPDYVVYPDGRAATVFHEPTGSWGQWGELELTATEVARDDLAKAARAYFEAHPERKPWEDAEEEEVWLLTVNGETEPFIAYESSLMGLVFTASDGNRIDADDEQISEGRRIWPKVSDD